MAMKYFKDEKRHDEVNYKEHGESQMFSKKKK